jgi:methylmalonyl-CoA carboxyltransferase large subunit
MKKKVDPILELTAVIGELRAELAQLTARVTQLEKTVSVVAHDAPVAPAVSASKEQLPAPAEQETLPEEIVLVISAAIAAFLGKRAHIRQIRLVGSVPWAQQGRVTIQAARNLDRFH